MKRGLVLFVILILFSSFTEAQIIFYENSNAQLCTTRSILDLSYLNHNRDL